MTEFISKLKGHDMENALSKDKFAKIFLLVCVVILCNVDEEFYDGISTNGFKVKCRGD